MALKNIVVLLVLVLCIKSKCNLRQFLQRVAKCDFCVCCKLQNS